MMTRILFLIVSAVTVASCSSPPTETPPEDAGADAAQDAGEVLPPLPSIDGLVELEDTNEDPTVVEVNLAARAHAISILPGAATSMLTYNDLFPGPLLHARVGDRVIVHFTNEMEEATTVHWHGLRISDQMDGSPRIQAPIQPGETFTYDFVVPDAGTFWYHTHLHQIEQFERGLYGALVVHERVPPAFTAERIFVADDVRLTGANAIAPFETSGPDIGRGRVGNTLILNGHAEPAVLSVPRGAIERWRFVMATNALSYFLRIRGATVRVIATDGGLLPTPFDLDRVEIAPGQRYEFEVRPLPEAESISLEALIAVLDEAGNIVDEPYELVHANIEGEVTADEPVYPTVELPSRDVEAENLNFMLSGGVVGDQVVFTINGVAAYSEGGHEHALLHTFDQNVPMRLTISSNVSPEHPFHIHGQFFQILSRGGVPVDEPGLRDTVLVRGAESVTVLSYFENPGLWMVHCHISEHSEHGMMGDIQVGDPAASDEHTH